MSTAIIWFKQDLRLHDNQAVYEAIKNHNTVIPFYCFENKQFSKTKNGFNKTGFFRAKFLHESVSELRKNLQRLNSNLIVRKGDTVKELQAIVEQFDVKDIYAQKEIHSEEIQIQKSLEKSLGVNWHFNAGFSLFHVNDTVFNINDTPKIFTDFRKKLEKYSKVRDCIATPEKAAELPNKILSGEIPSLKELELDPITISQNAALIPKGGENNALARLKHYLDDTEALSSYKLTRNGLLGPDYSSKLSFWLWNGCISPRKIYWEIKRYEKTIKKNQSTYWLIFELIWRDFFKYTSIKNGSKIFRLRGINGKSYAINDDSILLNKWINGQTGIPFIDANMLELKKTGFMSNRGRQNVASFFVNELQLDWRIGAEYFESLLIDYDVASNYGNWMYIAGVGNDPRDRYFNIILQAKRYDPEGEYVKTWIPELKNVEAKYIHHPWTMNETLFSNEMSHVYSSPVVEPDYWKKHY